MILMAVYHFCFDLHSLGVWQGNMDTSELWLDFRAVIMTLFTGLVGVSLFLAGADWSSRSYWRRFAWVTGCALAISVSSYWAEPRFWIFFGVLHLAALTTLMGPGLRRAPWVCLAGGVVLVLLPLVYRDPWFYAPGYVISGLSTLKPFTEDFAPLCPWLGVSMIGIWIGYVARQTSGARIWSADFRPLTWLGHYALTFYILHQAVLFPLAWLVSVSGVVGR